MMKISFLIVSVLIITGLVLAGVFSFSQEIEAGTGGAQPEFDISDLNISPTEVNAGESLTISATVSNVSNQGGAYEATLKIDGVVEETKIEFIQGKASTQITFTISKNIAGTYSVDFDGLTGSFTVTGKPASNFPTIPVVVGVIAALVVAGVLIFFLIRRKAA